MLGKQQLQILNEQSVDRALDLKTSGDYLIQLSERSKFVALSLFH